LSIKSEGNVDLIKWILFYMPYKIILRTIVHCLELYHSRGPQDLNAASVSTTREDVTGGWRKLHNEDLHNLYSSPNTISDQIKEDGMGIGMKQTRHK
jgi:hypothetical protein